MSYHKSCRAQYTSKTNVSHQTEKSEPPGPSASSSQPRRLSREDTGSFNIREQCFICGYYEKRKPDKSREKLTPISTSTGKSTRSKVTEAAEKRQDEVIRLRMLCHPDLFVFDGKYHRSCYSNYISDMNVEASGNKMQEQPLSTHDKAFHKLAHEIEQTVLSKQTQRVYTLARERINFISIKIDMGIPQQEAQQYSTWKLKQRLKGYFQSKLPSTTLIRMKKRLMGKPPPIPWLPSSTKNVEPLIMMKAFREQGRRHWMSQNILKSHCTDIPSHNRGQNHRPCSMPPCWK